MTFCHILLVKTPLHYLTIQYLNPLCCSHSKADQSLAGIEPRPMSMQCEHANHSAIDASSVFLFILQCFLELNELVPRPPHMPNVPSLQTTWLSLVTVTLLFYDVSQVDSIMNREWNKGCLSSLHIFIGQDSN